MSDKLNIVFMPISICDGMAMAGTKRLKNFAIHLIERKHIQVKNLVFLGESTFNINDSYLNPNNQKHIIYNKNPIGLISSLITVLNTLRTFKEGNNKNILYNYGYPDVLSIFYILFAKMIGYKIVFDIVEDKSSIKKYHSILNKIKVKSSNFLFRKIDGLSDGIIVISDFISQKVKNEIQNIEKIIHLPISVYFNDYSILKHKESNTTKIFYGGSFAAKDGINYLLDAFKIVADKYPQLQLMLTGSVDKTYFKKFNKDINKLIDDNRIIFLGYLKEEDYYRELGNSDILCMTRINSAFANAGFPFKLGEMLATGKPVVATKVGDVTKYLTNESAVLIEPESVTEIVNGIEMILKHKSLAIKIGEQGKKIAHEYFDSKKSTEKLLVFLSYI